MGNRDRDTQDLLDEADRLHQKRRFIGSAA